MQPIQQPAPLSVSTSQEAPKAPTTVDNRRDSDLPEPKDCSRHSKRPPSAGTITTSPPIKRPPKNHHGQALLNDKIPRKTHTKKGPDMVEPERYYGPSPPKPKDWGPLDKHGRRLFTYTEKGELAAGLYLTGRQMRQYLLGPSRYDNFGPPPRLPGVKQSRRKYRQGLTLWIGWPASMSNARYPRGGESTKCRFKNCRYRQTIQVGDPWVIMDERQNVDGEVIDPFHNAGYVHLFCLESHFDIVDLWHCIDIRPDYRSFKRESHPYFGLGYKLPGIDDRLQAWWVDAFKSWEVARSMGMKRPRSHNTSLAQCLVEFKLAHEPKGQTKNRQKRRGLDMAKHLGDPDLKMKLQSFKKHGLLDESGDPVADADRLLEEIENRQRQAEEQGATAQDTPQPGLDAVQIPSTLATPKIKAELRGQKRSRDEFAVEVSGDSNQAAGESSAVVKSEAPSLKRQRLEDNAPPSPRSVAQPTPALKRANTPNPVGNPDVKSEDPLPIAGTGHGASKKRSRDEDGSEEPDSKRIKTEDDQSSLDHAIEKQSTEMPKTPDPFEALAATADTIDFSLYNGTHELDIKLNDSVLDAFYRAAQEADDGKLVDGTD
ncbi:hypothetical protein F5B17DRAFT_400599 [Nemania serpens]|nr:hypothetical protein F5B17DRAFT_400599 [Nemania serpens]